MVDGPAAPVTPNTLARDEATGKSTIRAARLSEALRIDGQLDEALYRNAPGFGGLLQTAPRYGQPSTEKTEIWVSFDANNIYVSAEPSSGSTCRPPAVT